MGEVTNVNEFQDRRFHPCQGNLWDHHEPRFRHKSAKSRPNASIEFLANRIGIVEVDRKRFTVRKLDDHITSITVRRHISVIHIVGKHEPRVICVLAKWDYHDSSST